MHKTSDSYIDKAYSQMLKSTAAYLAKRESQTGEITVPFVQIPIKQLTVL